MSEIFIAYSKADRELVVALGAEISKFGWSVWWDKDLEAGELITDSIVAKIAEARIVLVLWTQTSLQSQWVIAEATLARRENKIVLPIIWGDGLKPPGIFPPVAPITVKANVDGSSLSSGDHISEIRQGSSRVPQGSTLSARGLD